MYLLFFAGVKFCSHFFYIGKKCSRRVHTSTLRCIRACFYLRSDNKDNQLIVNLICSKSRVAPISKVTLPRLELCGATLMGDLAEKLQKILKIKIDNVKHWTDSELVLSWILNDGNYKTFVANRVVKINSQTSSEQWKYINRKQNPALNC